MLLKSELVLLGVKYRELVKILREEYGINAPQAEISRAVTGSGSRPIHDRIKNALWDYVNKRKAEINSRA